MTVGRPGGRAVGRTAYAEPFEVRVERSVAGRSMLNCEFLGSKHGGVTWDRPGETGAPNCFRKEASPARLTVFSEERTAFPAPATLAAATPTAFAATSTAFAATRAAFAANPAAFAENWKVFTENETVFTEYAAVYTERSTVSAERVTVTAENLMVVGVRMNRKGAAQYGKTSDP
jgi:hypothetical protein